MSDKDCFLKLLLFNQHKCSINIPSFGMTIEPGKYFKLMGAYSFLFADE